MDIVAGILLIIGGLIMLLIGFKLINIFRGFNDIDKINIWYKKYGLLMRICGIISIIAGVINFI